MHKKLKAAMARDVLALGDDLQKDLAWILPAMKRFGYKDNDMPTTYYAGSLSRVVTSEAFRALKAQVGDGHLQLQWSFEKTPNKFFEFPAVGDTRLYLPREEDSRKIWIKIRVWSAKEWARHRA